jgi:hypothetical protein
MLNRPYGFCIWFIIAITTMMIAKYYYYKTLGFQYFLYDHCYYTNILCIASIYLYPYLPWLFRIVFIFSNGSVLAAVIVWRQGLVYHDFDRMVSIYVHIMPAALTLVMRWDIIPAAMIQQISVQDYVNAIIAYIIWQVLYYLKTEVWDREILDSNPKLQTSLRWLAKDKKNPTARWVLMQMRKIGVMKPDEDYEPSEFKTKLVFMTSQFIYSVLTFLPSALMYQSYMIHVTIIIIIFVVAVFNGASYYIDIFSSRYQLQFSKKEDMQKVVQAAAEVAYQAATSVRPTGSSSNNLARGSSGTLSSISPRSPVKASRLNKADSNGLIAAGELTGGAVGEESEDVGLSGADVPVASSLGKADTEGAWGEDVGEQPASSDAGGLSELTLQTHLEQRVEQAQQEQEVRDIIQVATRAFVDEWADKSEDEYDSEDVHSDYSGRDRGLSEDIFESTKTNDQDDLQEEECVTGTYQEGRNKDKDV